jgi:hypothetical protein
MGCGGRETHLWIGPQQLSHESLVGRLQAKSSFSTPSEPLQYPFITPSVPLEHTMSAVEYPLSTPSVTHECALS